MSFRTIRERDASDRLVAAGCEWAEQKDTPGIGLYLLMWAGVIKALLGVWVALVGSVLVGAPMIVVGAAVAWWGRWALKAYGESRRALLFRADDSVVTLTETLPIKVSDIQNVEYRLEYDTPYVVLATKDGRKIDVIGNRGLEDDDGRRIHMQLVQSHHEIRQAMAK